MIGYRQVLDPLIRIEWIFVRFLLMANRRKFRRNAPVRQEVLYLELFLFL